MALDGRQYTVTMYILAKFHTNTFVYGKIEHIKGTVERAHLEALHEHILADCTVFTSSKPDGATEPRKLLDCQYYTYPADSWLVKDSEIIERSERPIEESDIISHFIESVL